MRIIKFTVFLVFCAFCNVLIAENVPVEDQVGSEFLWKE